jgi:hypothetical protein
VNNSVDFLENPAEKPKFQPPHEQIKASPQIHVIFKLITGILFASFSVLSLFPESF